MTRSIATTPTVAVAADYAEAMITARRCRTVLFFLLLLIILGQLAIFFVVRYVPSMRVGVTTTDGPGMVDVDVDVDRADTQPATDETTEDADTGDTTSDAGADADAAAVTAAAGADADADADDAADDAGDAADAVGDAVTTPTTTEAPANTRRTASSSSSSSDNRASTLHIAANDVLRYLIPVANFLGILFAVLLSVVLFLIVMIMLVGRLIGVAGVTSGFVWSVLLLLLLFPWQAFLISEGRSPSAYAAAPGRSTYSYEYLAEQPAFKVPGVLYTYPELRDEANFDHNWKEPEVILKWARFLVFPLVTLLILMMVQAKSSRGLRLALGESEVSVSVNEGAM
jgi:hypothetical protein